MELTELQVEALRYLVAQDHAEAEMYQALQDKEEDFAVNKNEGAAVLCLRLALRNAVNKANKNKKGNNK